MYSVEWCFFYVFFVFFLFLVFRFNFVSSKAKASLCTCYGNALCFFEINSNLLLKPSANVNCLQNGSSGVCLSHACTFQRTHTIICTVGNFRAHLPHHTFGECAVQFLWSKKKQYEKIYIFFAIIKSSNENLISCFIPFHLICFVRFISFFFVSAFFLFRMASLCVAVLIVFTI